MAFKRILAPIDYSPNSRTSLDYASQLALELGASIDIVHVWDRPSYIADSLLVGQGEERRPLGDLIRETAEQEMRDFLKIMALPNSLVRREFLLSGEPARTLVQHLETEPYELVVVGTHGRSGFAHLLLGSVAERLVRYSPVPVLTVPASWTSTPPA